MSVSHSGLGGPRLPSPLVHSNLLWEESVRPGDCWSHILKRGTTLRLTDTEGNANIGALFLNADLPSERYNMPDTLKAQHTAHLTRGHVLYSDMGRILCSLTEDTCGWHDPIGGHRNSAQTIAQFGEARYQQSRNDFYRNAHDNFVIELEKYGLTTRDLPANVNFFSKVMVTEDGAMHFVTPHSQPGSFVDLRAEMNTLVVLDTNQHPLDPATQYAPKPVYLSVYRTAPATPDDFCRLSCPENERGFINTERFFL